jgi:multiubiquitin
MDASQKTGKPPEKTITILVNNRAVEISGREPTGADIKAAAGVPAEFKLYDAKGVEIANDTRVKIHEKEKFTAISGQDVS